METVSKHVRPRRTAEEIGTTVEEVRASGQSMQAFGLPRGISINCLRRWFTAGGVQTESGSSAVAVVQVNSSAQRWFAEVNGIRIYQPVSATFLKELVA